MEQSPSAYEYEKNNISLHVGTFEASMLPQTHGMFALQENLWVATSDIGNVKPLFYPSSTKSTLYPVEIDVSPILDMCIQKGDELGEQFGNAIRIKRPPEPHTVPLYKQHNTTNQPPLLQHFNGRGTLTDPYTYMPHISELNSIKRSVSHTILAFANTASLEQRPVYCNLNCIIVVLKPTHKNGHGTVELSIQETGTMPRSFTAIAADVDAGRLIPVTETRYYNYCLDNPADIPTPEDWLRQRMKGSQMVKVWFDGAQEIIAESAPLVAQEAMADPTGSTTKPRHTPSGSGSAVEIVIANVKRAVAELPGEVLPMHTLIGILAFLEEACDNRDEKLHTVLKALEEVKTSSAAANLLLSRARSDLETFVRDIS